MILKGWIIILAINTMSRLVYCEKKRYDGHKVMKIEIADGNVWNVVQNIISQHIPPQDQDIWKFPSANAPAYIRISQQHVDDVVSSLKIANIQYDIFIENVQKLISTSENENTKLRNEQLSVGFSDIVGTFPTYDEVLAWMEEITQMYPEIARTLNIGYSTYGKPMVILKLGFDQENKWNIWMDAGLHAREWIGPSTAIYIADQLIQGYAKNDSEIVRYLQILDFNILPVANPDGYEYTHTVDRLWRKNRRPVSPECIGVDLNRNFGFQWGGVNADNDPCSNLYMGPYPESEREVLNIVTYILPEASKYIWYMAYHSWGEQFFTRWDYTSTESPSDHEELLDLAQRTVVAINSVHGEVYEAGIAPELMYAFSGSSSDWSRGVAQIKYPYLVELRDSNGTYGFVAPPEEIIPCGEENWAGAKVILTEIIDKYGDILPPV